MQYQYGTGTAAITVTSTAPTPDPLTQIQNATARIQTLNNSLSGILSATRSLSDRLLGGQANEQSKASSPTPVPNGDLAMIHAEIDVYEKMVALLSDQITRLQQV